MTASTLRPDVGVALFVWRDSKFLIGKRVGKHGQDTWSVPGGHLEFGESWKAAAARETEEETGVKVKNIRTLAVTNDIFADKHSISIWLEADWHAGEPIIREPEKLTELRWVDFLTLPAPLFEPCWENLRKTKPELFAPKGRA